MEQRFTFDQVATIYQAARPGYSDALIDDIVAYAGLTQADQILEVGCGSGQATASFARRGHAILATDPGAEMLRGAREALRDFDNVTFFETTFEALPETSANFRLIVAAQSWHWVAPEVRYVKAARLLADHGTLAVFGREPLLDEFTAAIDDAGGTLDVDYQTHLYMARRI